MLQALRQKTIITMKIGVVALFLFMSTLGLWHSFLMPMDDSGNMAGCPFMGESSALCQMSATEHIQAWQMLFIAVPQKVFSSFLITLFVVWGIILFAFYRRWHLGNLRLFALYRLYAKKHLSFSFFSYLKEAFSQGILNSRIYA